MLHSMRMVSYSANTQEIWLIEGRYKIHRNYDGMNVLIEKKKLEFT
jgi:hypothetical protein